MANLFSRVWSAFMAGVSASSRAWKDAQYPITDLNWDTYDSRMVRYWFNTAYYHNIAYDSLNRYAAQYKHEYDLYKNTRGIYNPTRRYADIKVSKTYPGAIDYETFTDGAIPIVTSNPNVLDAMRQLLLWSNWGNQKDLFVRIGARLGDSFIKVVDNPAKQRVHLEILSPEYVKYVEKDEVGNIKALHIEYKRIDYERVRNNPTSAPMMDNETYTYTEVHERAEDGRLMIRTYKDGELHGFYRDAFGNFIYEWENPYGFVPVTHALDVDEGLMFGATGLNGSRTKIDEINDMASKTHDQIRKIVNPIWASVGAQASSIEFDNLERDEMPLIGLPEGTDLKAVIADLDFDGAFKAIEGGLMELERDVPLLSLHRLKQHTGNVSGVAVRNLFDDAISQAENGQSAYDAPFVRACQMAMTMGAMGGYRGFERLSERSYENGDLEMHLRTRLAFKDSLTKAERLNFWQSSGAPPKKVWQELGASEQEIDEWTAEAESTEEAQERAIVGAVNRLRTSERHA